MRSGLLQVPSAELSATEKGTDFHFQADLSGPLAIVMGSEEDGVSPELIRSCDRLLRIPMIGAISSLNVSVACGIMLYEAIRQRMKSDDIQL